MVCVQAWVGACVHSHVHVCMRGCVRGCVRVWCPRARVCGCRPEHGKLELQQQWFLADGSVQPGDSREWPHALGVTQAGLNLFLAVGGDKNCRLFFPLTRTTLVAWETVPYLPVLVWSRLLTPVPYIIGTETNGFPTRAIPSPDKVQWVVPILLGSDGPSHVTFMPHGVNGLSPFLGVH